MPSVQAEEVPAGLHRHHDLFERAVAGALAQAVDGALDLARAADLDAGQRVGHRHAQVVVAMHRPDRLVGVGNALAQRLDELAEQLGHRVADGVRHVDRGRALGDHRLQHAAEEVRSRSGSRPRARTRRRAHRLRAKRTDAWPARAPAPASCAASSPCAAAMVAMKVWMRARRRALQRLGRARDVAVVGARQRADGGILDRAGDGLHGLEVAVGARRRSRPRSRRPSGAPAGARCAASRPWSWRRRATARRRARWCRK